MREDRLRKLVYMHWNAFFQLDQLLDIEAKSHLNLAFLLKIGSDDNPYSDQRLLLSRLFNSFCRRMVERMDL